MCISKMVDATCYLDINAAFNKNVKFRALAARMNACTPLASVTSRHKKGRSERGKVEGCTREAHSETLKLRTLVYSQRARGSLNTKERE